MLRLATVLAEFPGELHRVEISNPKDSEHATKRGSNRARLARYRNRGFQVVHEVGMIY